MSFNIQKAKESGASEEQIIEYLSSTRRFDVRGAKDAGADNEQIIQYLMDTQPSARVSQEFNVSKNEMDARSAEETGATFEAKTGEGPVMAGLKSVGNLPSSAWNLTKNIASAVLNPIDTATGLFKVTKGLGEFLGRKGLEVAGVEKVAQVPESEEEQTFGALTDSLKERFGSLENLQRTATNDPVGFGTDVLAVLSGVGGILGKTGIKVPAITTKISGISNKVKSFFKQKTIGPVEKLALSQQQKALNLNPSDIRKIERPNVAGTSPEAWTLERGIQGSQRSMADQLGVRSVESKALVDEGLNAIKVRIAKTKVPVVDKILTVLEDTFKGTLGNEKMLQRLEDFRQLKDLNLTELNELKRLVNGELAIFKTTGELKTSAQAKGLNNLRDELKTFIENEATKNGFADVKALNKETQVAVEIEKAINKRLNVKGTNLEIGYRDIVLGVGGTVAGSPLIGVGAVALKKILESSRFRSAFANKLHSLSDSGIATINTALSQRNYAPLFEIVAPIINELAESEQ